MFSEKSIKKYHDTCLVAATITAFIICFTADVLTTNGLAGAITLAATLSILALATKPK